MVMLSVIIPVFNEADRASQAVENWLESGIVGEVIIADGGSLDGTPDFARAAGAQVIKTPRGRGRQMAAGAGAAVRPPSQGRIPQSSNYEFLRK